MDKPVPEDIAEQHAQIIDNKLTEIWTPGDYGREFLLLDFLYGFKHSTPGVLSKVLGYRHNPNYSEFVRNKKDLLITKPGWGPFPKIVTLSREGWRKADQARRELRIEHERAGYPLHLPRFGYLEPSKITKRLLPHHLLTQMAIWAFSGAEKAAIDSRLALRMHRPDAVVESNDGTRWGIEIDRTPMDLGDISERLARLQWLLAPRRYLTDQVATGSGGIDRWLILISSRAQEKEYRRVLNRREARFLDQRGVVQTREISPKRFVTVGIERFQWGSFEKEVGRCLER